MLRHHGVKHFYLNAMGNVSDADSLLTALRNAKLFHAVLEDHAITTQAMRAAAPGKITTASDHVAPVHRSFPPSMPSSPAQDLNPLPVDDLAGGD